MRSIEFQKIADILAKQHKITVKEGKGWAANIKTRKVFYKKKDIYNLPEDHILGLLLHEIAHIHYSTETICPKINKELTAATVNTLEDIAIENIISKDYPNAGEILDSTKEEVLNTLIKILPKMKNISKHEQALLYAATRFEGRGYEKQTKRYEKVGNKIAEIMKKQKKEIYERNKTSDLLPLAKKIVKILIKEFKQPTEMQKREMMQDVQDHIMAEDGTETTKAGKKLIAKLGGGKGYQGKGIISKDIEYIDKIADKAIIIGNQLRSILKRNNAMEFGGRYRTGKLMTKRFVRIKAIKDRRPFARRILKSNQSYAFAIASDASGSMFNNRKVGSANIDYAMTSLYMTGEALRIAGISRSLMIFGEDTVTLNPLNRKTVYWNEIISNENLENAQSGGTSISVAIRKCTQELARNNAERKIMVILSDGISDREAMARAHKEAQKENIQCIAISIGDYTDTFNAIFKKKNHINIPNTSDHEKIGKAFTQILKETITLSK